MDAVVLEYVTRDYIYAYTVAVYWRQVNTQPEWRVIAGIEAHQLARRQTPAPARRGQVCRRLYWAEDDKPCWGEAVVLGEVAIGNAPSERRVLLDIAWRTAAEKPWVVEKLVNPTNLLPVQTKSKAAQPARTP
ncbi:hypothetical protein AURDEDRAFT_113676 [Auricularia subglabra TFB-10046 SS5]|nr:hypothetical protein AURDEDRAFT_113676 [Auricularia subglabra TFB-10046 SS5]